MHILISAYACAPDVGSEPGVGWNWITHLARYCKITVITEAGFQEKILSSIPQYNLPYPPEFHFIEVTPEIRKQCWNQGDWRFYRHYRQWQWRAYELAKKLMDTKPFDVAHQLNMIGYREPGYLWKLPVPFVWGPIGGHEQMAWSFLSMLSWKEKSYYTLRNILNAIQMRTSLRVRKAASSAKALIAATPPNQKAFQQIHAKEAILINETGTFPCTTNNRILHNSHRPLQLLWCGKFMSQKALPIALHALSIAQKQVKAELHIVGTGKNEIPWKNCAQQLGIEHLCHWHGQLSHDESLKRMASSDCLVFTSILDATTTVVMEALSYGIPVICHNSFGFGSVVDDSCGIKIPMIHPSASIQGFAQAIVALGSNPGLLEQLSQGAWNRAKEFLWDDKAKKMYDIYKKLIAL